MFDIITVNVISLSAETLRGLTYHPEARIRLAARTELERRAGRV